MGPLTQEDPIGIAGGLNLYGYANGDPINFSDPFGLCVPWPQCALAAANAGSRVGTVVGGGLGGLFGLGGGALPGAAIGNRVGWLVGAGAASAGALWLMLSEGADELDLAEGGEAEEALAPTADEIISAEKKGSIRREFPGEMLGKTQAEIDALARGGDRAARTARKLLTDSRFNKGNE